MANQTYDFQIIANLMAGKGESKKKLQKLKDFLDNNKLTYNSLEIEKPTPISQIPDDGRKKIKKGVICLGGDGTVSETVGYVLNNKIAAPIAIIPTGTANIIASTLGLTAQKDNLGFLLKTIIREISVGVCDYQNGKTYFLLGLGLGFEENFLRLTKERFKTRIGTFSYIFAAFSELLSLKKIPLTIQSADFQVKANICLLAVLNLQPVVLTHFPLFRDQDIKADDNILNVYFVEYKSYFQALLGTLSFHILGDKNFGTVKEMHSPEFTLESQNIVGTQIDGELRGNLPVKIYLSGQKCKFLIP